MVMLLLDLDEISRSITIYHLFSMCIIICTVVHHMSLAYLCIVAHHTHPFHHCLILYLYLDWCIAGPQRGIIMIALSVLALDRKDIKLLIALCASDCEREETIMKFDCIERHIHRLFAAYGRIVAEHPLPFIIILVMVAAALGGGFVCLNHETDVEYLFTPQVGTPSFS